MIFQRNRHKTSLLKRAQVSLSFLIGGEQYIKRDNFYYYDIRTQTIMCDKRDSEYLFDFRELYRYKDQDRSEPSVFGATELDEERRKWQLKAEGKTPPSPKEVINDLKTSHRSINIDVKDKVNALEKKWKLTYRTYANLEMVGILERLKLRKFYKNKIKKFFDRFKSTSPEELERFLKSHNLVIKEADIYISCFNDKTISIMHEYKEKTIQCSGKKPVFYVITINMNSNPNNSTEDSTLVLLVQSPFGFFWQILDSSIDNIAYLSEI